jgi:hypothetical protein
MTDSTRPVETLSVLMQTLYGSGENDWKECYLKRLTPGSVWRENFKPTRICKVEEVFPHRISAFWLRFNDFGNRCVRSYRDDFYVKKGSFLQRFSPEDEIQTVSTLVSSLKSTAVVSREQTIAGCREIIEKRIDALCKVVDEKEKDLLLKTKEILLTDIKNFHF